MDASLGGFQTFITTVMGVPVANLPLTAPIIPFCFNYATNAVNPALNTIPNFDVSQPTTYATAIYYLAADLLINFATDTSPSTYFSDLRKSFGCNTFVGGVITSSGDGTTSQSMQVAEFVSNLNIGDLQNMKTPYGRQYLAIAQSVGTLWGMT